MQGLSTVLYEQQLSYIRKSNHPIIIWGIKNMGERAYQICTILDLKVNCFGDNNRSFWGEIFHGEKVCSLVEIEKKYSNAIIIIATQKKHVEKIRYQLEKSRGSFYIIRPEWIDYHYEITVLHRQIKDKERFADILCESTYHYDIPEIYSVNKKILQKYIWKCNDFNIKKEREIIDSVYGIYEMDVEIKEDNAKIGDFLKEVSESGRVGFINVKRNMSISNVSVLKESVTEENLKRALHAYLYDTPFIYNEREKEDKVVLVQLFNGLANQMLMYSFGMLIQKYSGKKVIFDDSVLAIDCISKRQNKERVKRWTNCSDEKHIEEIIKNTREGSSFYKFKKPEIVEVFHLPISLLSDYFTDKEWERFIQKVSLDWDERYVQPIPAAYILQRFGFSMTVIQDSQIPESNYQVEHYFKTNSQVIEIPYHNKTATDFLIHNQFNAYYIGVWATGKSREYLFLQRCWLRGFFRFPQYIKQCNLGLAKEIQDSYAVMIHIRRKDFINYGLATNPLFFAKAICKTAAWRIEKIRYYVFSDDLEWCRENADELGLSKADVVYVDNNRGKNSYGDIYLMSLGKVLIPSRYSTFGYIALLLSESIEFCADTNYYMYMVDICGDVNVDIPFRKISSYL